MSRMIHVVANELNENKHCKCSVYEKHKLISNSPKGNTSLAVAYAKQTHDTY